MGRAFIVSGDVIPLLLLYGRDSQCLFCFQIDHVCKIAIIRALFLVQQLACYCDQIETSRVSFLKALQINSGSSFRSTPIILEN